MRKSRPLTCLQKCGHEKVTGILLDDPDWLEKERQLAKCDKCQTGAHNA